MDIYLLEILIGKHSSPILLGESAKNAILKYVETQITNVQNNRSNGKNVLDIQWRLSGLLENLDDDLLLDEDFKRNILDLIIKTGYLINVSSKDYLKQNGELAEQYYRKLSEKNSIYELLNANILSPELVQNKSFLKNYINLLVKNGVDNDTIINTLTHNEECINAFKADTELIQFLFENHTPTNLEEFFNIFYKEDELKDFFSKQDRFDGKLLRLSQLYAKDPTILQSLNGKLLEEQYKNIPNYKMQLIVKNSRFQEKILKLNDFEYCLYSKMTKLVSEKTSRWNRFENNIVENLADGYYSELVADLYEKARQGNTINAKDIEMLTFLFSKECYSKSFFNSNIKDAFVSQRMSENEIEQQEIAYSNNVFNITKKIELEHFEEIKELVCDTVLVNPSLEDAQLTKSVNKYLKKFVQMEELDRIKLALLEKYYNMDLSEASNIIRNFSNDIDNMVANNEFQNCIIDQIRAIKNIFECSNIDILSRIGDLDILVETDLATSTYLVEETKEMFEQAYKEGLYVPKEEDKVKTITFDGKSIDIFDGKIDFSMIVKRIGFNSNNSQKIWNDMTKDGEYGRKDLRYYTCCSYMTDENLLNFNSDNDVIIGFAQGIGDYSLDAIYPQDAHTPFYGGDNIYNDLKSSYMLPTTLETNTDNNYNEVVINTLAIDEQGQIKKMQPDYVVYVKKQGDFDNDPLWIKSQKVASEFGIPIVIIDKERVKESEKNKIGCMSSALNGKTSSNDILKFVKKVEHYIWRYGRDNILEYAPNDKISFLVEYMKRKKVNESKKVQLPNVEAFIIGREQVIQGILSKQVKLNKHITDGEGER